MNLQSTNSHFLFVSLTEFISVWGQGGEASLNLTTSAGLVNVQLNCTLGHPGAPYFFPPSSFPSPPPAPPPRRPRHCGPSEQEKNNLRAARHQAARVTSPVSSTTSPAVAASSASSPLSDATVPVTSPTAPTHDILTQKPKELFDVIPQLYGLAEQTEVIEEDSFKEELDLSHLPTADDPEGFDIYINNLNQEKIQNMSKQELNHMNAELARKIAFKNATEKKKKHTKSKNS